MLPPLPLSMQSAKNVCVSLNRTTSLRAVLSCSQCMKSHNRNVKDEIKMSHEKEYWWQNTEQSSWLKWLFKFRVEKSGQGLQRDAKEVQNLHKNNPWGESKCEEKFSEYKKMEKKRNLQETYSDYILGVPSKNNHKVGRNITQMQRAQSDFVWLRADVYWKPDTKWPQTDAKCPKSFAKPKPWNDILPSYKNCNACRIQATSTASLSTGWMITDIPLRTWTSNFIFV